MANALQPLPGFRDFAPPERLVARYFFEAWSRVASRYGFSEFEAPIVEGAALYLKKSGGELSSQLFRFADQGGRDCVLRPELTASLARIVAGRQRDFPKPLKWFEIGRCFRYEKPQRGRLREFYQFNADVLGEPSPAADAELIALAIDIMRELGFVAGDFVVRLSDRRAWQEFCDAQGVTDVDGFLQAVDKLDREPAEKTEARLRATGTTTEAVQGFISDPGHHTGGLAAVRSDLEARGLGDFVEIDLSVVRGLAYYSGLVFEVFDAGRALRSVAGGGRYDNLVAVLTDGATGLPATGFAMGDCVIAELVNETPHALARMQAWRQRQRTCEVYVVIADEGQRPAAMRLVSDLRAAGIRTDFPLAPARVNRQFKAAGHALARFAVVVGSEFPELKLKVMASRHEESLAPNTDPVACLQQRLAQPDGPLLA